MRNSLRARTILGALVLAAALLPALAQAARSAAQDGGASATPAPAPAPPVDAAGRPIGPAADAPPAPPAPDMPQSPASSNTSAAKDPNAPRFATPNDPSASAAAGTGVAVDVSAADSRKALAILRRSVRDYAPCTSVRLCLTDFDSYGVGFTFADGTIAAFSHEHRGKLSAHDCSINARDALARGDRSMAVQWMMAAQTDILNRNWISEHPDAMLAIIRGYREWG